MESELISSLMDYGLGGLFLGYLSWMSFMNERKLAEKESRYEERIDAIQSKAIVSEEKIRTRYSEVVDRYNKQIESFTENRQAQIQAYAEERSEARRVMDQKLEDIKKEINENGIAIARLQTQMESWSVRVRA